VTVVELRGIRKRFGATVALAEVDLELRAGEIHAWAGENGAGKSTLARVLAGLHGDHQGGIRVGGLPARLASPAAARDCGIALVQQELSRVPELSVAENAFLGRAPRALPGVRGPRRDAAARACAARRARGQRPGRDAGGAAGRVGRPRGPSGSDNGCFGQWTGHEDVV
jgi:ABC-type sugar transport system ATPase subunit